MNRKRSRRFQLEKLETRLPLAAPHPLDLGVFAAGDGTAGFVVNGENTGTFGSNVGFDASTLGDINGDGFDDFVLGAPFAAGASDGSLPGFTIGGESFIVFGKASGFPAELDVADLDGTNGFRLPGQNQENRSGTTVSAGGDINGDGLHDIVIDGNTARDPDDIDKDRVGAVYVVFGRTTPYPAVFDFNTLDGNNGFTVIGIDEQDHMGYNGGGGDFNGDGFHDLIFGAANAWSRDFPPRGGRPGEAYVLFGKANGWDAEFRLTELDGINGFTIRGEITSETSNDARIVRYPDGDGDFNGDGYDDFIIGASTSTIDGVGSGRVYVVYGKPDPYPIEFRLSAIDGTNGIKINGIDEGDFAGERTSFVGDINGDGLTDVGIGADRADSDSGEAYVVFGTNAGTATVELDSLTGANGFLVQPTDPGDQLGIFIDAVGDINGDGYDDFGIGAGAADLTGGTNHGEAYVVFGKATAWPPVFDQSTLDGDNGFRAEGIDPSDSAGFVVTTAGDINGDSFDDLIVTAPGADPNGSSSGESYIIFGNNFTDSVTHLGDSNNNILLGDPGANSILGGLGDDELVGGGGSDVLRGGQGDDILEIADTTFLRLDGGRGVDTLKLSGAGMILDLTQTFTERITGIEWIDVTGSGSNTLKLDRLPVLNTSDTSNTLHVRANTDDTVDFGTGWTTAAPETINGEVFDVFTQGQAILKIATINDDVTPPTVSEVIVGGSSWTDAFIDTVDGGDIVTPGNEVGMPIEAGHRVSNAGINRVYVKFSEAITIDQSNVELIGSDGPIAFTQIDFDPQTMMVELRLNNAIEFSKVRLAIADVVTDAAGNLLDGNSNGAAGGIFDFRFDSVTGDINGDGQVFTTDLAPWQAAFNSQPGDLSYDAAADLNADGEVFTTDLFVWQNNLNRNIADLTEPAATSFVPSASSASNESGKQNDFGPVTQTLAEAEFESDDFELDEWIDQVAYAESLAEDQYESEQSDLLYADSIDQLMESDDEQEHWDLEHRLF